MQFEGSYGETIQMFVVLPPVHREGAKVAAGAGHPRWSARDQRRHLPLALAAASLRRPGLRRGDGELPGLDVVGQDFAQRILGGWGDRRSRT
jgi:hypothetical protein